MMQTAERPCFLAASTQRVVGRRADANQPVTRGSRVDRDLQSHTESATNKIAMKQSLTNVRANKEISPCYS